MKTLFLLIIALFCAIGAIAQPWIEPTAGNIYYQGNVGIGTTSPTEKLEVNGIIKFPDNSVFYLNKKADGIRTLIQTSRTDNTVAGYLKTNGWGGFSFTGGDYWGLAVGYDMPALQTGMVIKGNVGIGTTSPGYKLEVAGDIGLWAGAGARRGWFTYPNWDANSLAIIGGYNNNGGVTLQTIVGGINNDRLTVLNNGNVGIGTTAPAFALDIVDNNTSSGNVELRLNQAGTGQAGIYIKRSGGTASEWIIYNPMNSADLRLFSGSDKVTFQSSGNVGIGTTTPGNKLQIGSAVFDGTRGTYDNSRLQFLIGNGAGTSEGYASMMLSSTYNNATNPNYGIIFNNGASTSDYDTWAIMNDGPANVNGGLKFAFAAEGTNMHAVTPFVTFQKSGNVGIGTTTPEAKLTVKGKIVASEIQVKGIGAIADYVFKPDYPLMSLDKVENFVKQNRHLPEVPSEKEFKKEGMNVAEMNALLLKKVEELTLYAIEQNKRIVDLDKQNAKIQVLEEKIAALEKTHK